MGHKAAVICRSDERVMHCSPTCCPAVLTLPEGTVAFSFLFDLGFLHGTPALCNLPNLVLIPVFAHHKIILAALVPWSALPIPLHAFDFR